MSVIHKQELLDGTFVDTFLVDDKEVSKEEFELASKEQSEASRKFAKNAADEAMAPATADRQKRREILAAKLGVTMEELSVL